MLHSWITALLETEWGGGRGAGLVHRAVLNQLAFLLLDVVRITQLVRDVSARERVFLVKVYLATV